MMTDLLHQFDLILSKDTMISTYFEVDKKGVEHVYYLVNKKIN